MSTRSELMIKIRPKVEFDKSLDSSAAERFQNETLRPIAKFQNEIIISYFHYGQNKALLILNLFT